MNYAEAGTADLLTESGDEAASFQISLFIYRNQPGHRLAARNLTEICDRNVPGRYKLEIVDIAEAPERMTQEGILAAPAAIRYDPSPRRCAIGDFSDPHLVEEIFELSDAPLD